MAIVDMNPMTLLVVAVLASISISAFASDIPATVELHRYPYRSSGEVEELALSLAGVEHKIRFVPLPPMDLEHFDGELTSGRLPFPTLPTLAWGEKKIPGARAVQTFLAQNFGLDGGADSATDVSIVVSAAEAARRLYDTEYAFALNEEHAVAFVKSTLPNWLGYFERFLFKRESSSTSPWFAATPEPTLADVHVFSLLDTLLSSDLTPDASDLLVSYPKLGAFYHAFGSLPIVRAYIASQSRSVAPNAPGAHIGGARVGEEGVITSDGTRQETDVDLEAAVDAAFAVAKSKAEAKAEAAREAKKNPQPKSKKTKKKIPKGKAPFVFNAKQHLNPVLYDAAKAAIKIVKDAKENDDDDDEITETLEYRRAARKTFNELQPEVGPDVFHFPFFKQQFCEDLLEYVNSQIAEGLWVFNTDGEDEGEGEQSGEKDLIFQMWKVPGFKKFWTSALKWAMPILHAKWPVLELRKFGDPTILKYDMVNYPFMKEHADFETLAFIVVLANDYTGGGTYFPKWNLTITGQQPGSIVMYPGGLSHMHSGKRITSGERYVLLGDVTGGD